MLIQAQTKEINPEKNVTLLISWTPFSTYFHFITEALRSFLTYFKRLNAGEEVSTRISLKKYKVLLILDDCGLFRRNTDHE